MIDEDDTSNMAQCLVQLHATLPDGRVVELETRCLHPMVPGSDIFGHMGNLLNYKFLKAIGETK